MPKLFSLIRTARRSGATTINLAQRRTWHGEGEAGEQQNGQQGDANKGDGKYNPSTLEDALKIIGALSKRVEEREADAQRFKGERDTLTAAQRKQLEEQGNYKTIAEQQAIDLARLKAVEERATDLEKRIRAGNDARIATVPEQMRSIIPMDYPPEKLQEWLDKNAALLAKQPAPDYDAGAGAGGSGGSQAVKLTPDEVAMAKRMGVTPEEFMKAKARKQEK